jgi:hypothetical protein
VSAATKGSSKDGGGSPFGPITVSGNQQTTYTPWLLVRYAAGDLGYRPLPSGIPFWESPDVWVTSSRGVNQPVPGEENQVFARVTNYGLQQANGVVVKFWWANPSIAITESTAHLIGTGFADIASMRSAIVACPQPWVPIEENGGHECLLAEAYVPALDPLTAPMDPAVDRHVGQKNEQLVEVAPGQPFTLQLAVANASPIAQPVTVDVHPVLSGTVPPLLAVRFPHARNTKAPKSAGVALSLDLKADSAAFMPPSALFARRLLSTTLPQAVEPGAATAWTPQLGQVPQISRALQLEAWESRVLRLGGVVPPSAEAGQTYVFRILERLGPLILGGYTVTVLVRDRVHRDRAPDDV